MYRKIKAIFISEYKLDFDTCQLEMSLTNQLKKKDVNVSSNPYNICQNINHNYNGGNETQFGYEKKNSVCFVLIITQNLFLK